MNNKDNKTAKKVGEKNLSQPGCDRWGMMGVMFAAVFLAVWAVMEVNGVDVA